MTNNYISEEGQHHMSVVVRSYLTDIQFDSKEEQKKKTVSWSNHIIDVQKNYKSIMEGIFV